LGPLTNPAKPNRMLLGVGTPEMGEIYAKVFAKQHKEELHGKGVAVVVHSDDGMDEISTATKTHAWVVRGGEITERDFGPEDFGLPRHSLPTIESGIPGENSAKFRRLLAGEYKTDPSLVPLLDFVLMNSSVALFVCDRVADFKDGVSIAREAIETGRALELLDRYVRESHKDK